MLRQEAEQLDQQDLLAAQRHYFHLPDETIYLCGHSLGAMLKQTSRHVTNILNEQWGRQAVSAWNQSAWIDMPQRLGQKIAPMLGANANEVVVADSTSVNLYKLIHAGLMLRPDRHVILTDDDNFPADLYIAQGIAKQHPHIKVVCCSRHEIAHHLNKTTALLMLTQVNYRTGELYDLKEMTMLAHAAGALTLYDLSHSTGVIPLALNNDQVDMAVGCTYKYINGGPGAPAFLFVAKHHHQAMTSPLSGWMGHIRPFAFESEYIPASGMNRFFCGTPSIVSMGALESSLDFLQPISIDEIRHKSQQLGNYFIRLLTEKCLGIHLVSPPDAHLRGGHVAFTHPNAFAIKQALLNSGVICDYRAPDLLRFGLSPLYTRYVDVYDTVDRLADILNKKSYSLYLDLTLAAVT